MSKKTLTVILLGMSLMVVSCVDKTYDLANKQIATDVKLEDNKIALPVGSLKPIVLEDLIDVEKIEMLEKTTDGVYNISMSDKISIEESIEPIKLNIDPIEHNVNIDFDDVNISNIHIGGEHEEKAKFETPTISLDGLNANLPKLESNVPIKFNIGDFEGLLNQIQYLPEDKRVFPFDDQVSTKEQNVACNIDYALPEQVRTINSIKLGSKSDSKGVLVKVVVTNPKVLETIDKKMDFWIEFPEIFKLAKDKQAEQGDRYQVYDNNSSIKVEGFDAKGETSSFSFYITDIVDIDSKIADGRICIYENIKYNIDYKAKGDIKLKPGMTANDFAFDVKLDAQLSFLDVAGETKDIKVDFAPIEMDFGGDFDNLEYIKKIKYVEFDETASYITFETLMSKDWLDVFELSDCALKIDFPAELEISKENSIIPEGVCYDADKHAFYVYDLSVLASTHWELAPKKITLDRDVVQNSVTGKHECHMGVSAKISFVDSNDNEMKYFMLAGTKMESMVSALDKLKGDKEAVFKMEESDLTIKDAVVETTAIQSSLDTETSFDLNEEIPSEILRIERIGFEKDAEITFYAKVLGLQDLKTDVKLDMSVVLPSFLKLRTDDKDSHIYIDENGILRIETGYNPSEGTPLNFKLWCTGIDFMTEDFGSKGLEPIISAGKSYISYPGNIVVKGNAVIEDENFHSTVLENEISFNVVLEVDEISVKTFHGIYSKELSKIDEKITLDLGEDLDFLKEAGNSITLANPQVEFVLTNTIGVPVDIELQIVGSDENGVNIGEPIEKTLSILPAEYDEKNDVLLPVKTKFFLTTDKNKNSKGDGYTNVEIGDLANLLQKIPHDINFKVNPIIKTDVTHHVDISAPIKLDGSYSVVIPLEFDDMHLSYEETIDGLQSEIGETLEMFSNVSLAVKMDIFNTLPLGLAIKMKPYDAAGKEIKDIEIADLVIKAGSGANIVDANGNLTNGLVPQNFVFEISNKTGNLSALDKLVMSVEATSNNTTGSAGLASGQGLKISNIVFEISGDLEVDLSK